MGTYRKFLRPDEEPPATILSIPQPGTMALRLFRNVRTGDLCTVATDVGVASVLRDGYELVEVLGHVFIDPRPGTRPLVLLYNPLSRDHLTTVSTEERRRAERAGYVFVRVEGYVPRS